MMSRNMSEGKYAGCHKGKHIRHVVNTLFYRGVGATSAYKTYIKKILKRDKWANLS